MRVFSSFVALMAFSASSYAAGGGTIPEPGVLGLVGIGAAGLFLALRSKK
jgi:hypothetical protein